ncbi:ABC transporter permease [Fodinisporobacter ferrooxydans]|uniref:ABC transporter permease n=1 Tax=Fodinisporobacter ferrooxydans TaxID=2901836 RepID=A0ABY4CKB1_9BACL|nr:ABC transporter permease [Alicyclobacillaceae bacterium MYW30-H2]
MNSLLSRNAVGNAIKQQGILIAFILLLIAISFHSNTFLTANNILLVLRQVSIVGIMAVSMTFVIISGDIDLSVGSLLSLTTVLVVNLHDKVGPGLAILITIAVALVIGCINGILIGFFKLNSLIITLAMLPALQGITLIYSGGKSFIIKNPSHTWFKFFGSSYVLGVPVPVLIFLVVAIVFSILLTKTTFGRQIFAVGGNRIASEFTGIRSKWVTFSVYMLSAFCTSIGAIIMGSRLMSSQNTLGQGYELDVIAAVILGGTSLMGGSGSVFKTVIGVLILGFIKNGMILLGFPFYAQWLVEWFVIIAAVWVDLISKRRKIFV